MVVVPCGAWPAAGIAGLLNSQLLRFTHGVALRTSVAGGGRRDVSVTPRVLKSLPIPQTDEACPLITELSIAASVAADTGAPSDASVFAAELLRVELATTLAAWPLNWTGWPERAALTPKNLRV